MRHSIMIGAAVAALGAAAAMPSDAQAQDQRNFTWSGDLGARRTVYLNNVNGAVTFEQGTGRKVEVTAVKRWRRGDPDDVRIETRVSSTGDVIICALFHERQTCDEDGYHGRNDRDRDRRDNNDVSVEFRVKIPADARVRASTVNGDLTIGGTSGEIRASTVNGDLVARSTAGRVEASTVNGSVTVRTAAPSSDGLDYRTVNGSVTVELPAGTNADVNLSTVNGGISSDFPMTLDGMINPRRIRASIGSGGPTLKISTVNGSIRIRKI
jgi:hypothetical protein